MCRPKHVEQLRNTGIINSTTLSHFVGSFYEKRTVLRKIIFFGTVLRSLSVTFYIENLDNMLPNITFCAAKFLLSFIFPAGLNY